MEHLLAYHVVKAWKYDAKVQLPLIERMFIYELGICKAYLAGTE